MPVPVRLCVSFRIVLFWLQDVKSFVLKKGRYRIEAFHGAGPANWGKFDAHKSVRLPVPRAPPPTPPALPLPLALARAGLGLFPGPWPTHTRLPSCHLVGRLS